MSLRIPSRLHVDTPHAVRFCDAAQQGADAVIAAVWLIELVGKADFCGDVFTGEWAA